MNKTLRALIVYDLPPILFMLLIFGGSSQSQMPPWMPVWVGEALEFLHVDKIVHATEYALLGVLWIRSLTRGGVRKARGWRILLAVSICIIYGATDELHQMFVPNRTPDLYDLVADAAGCLAAASVPSLWRRFAPTKSTPTANNSEETSR